MIQGFRVREYPHINPQIYPFIACRRHQINYHGTTAWGGLVLEADPLDKCWCSIERRSTLSSARMEELRCCVRRRRALKLKQWCLLACLALLLTVSRGAHASDMNPFEYSGSETTLLGLMENEIGDGLGGSGVFAGAGFGTNMVNIFLVDLSGASTSLGNAGVTLFVMWGNGVNPGSNFSASVSFSNIFSDPVGDTPTQGISEVFALGEGVSISNGMFTIGPVGGGDIGGEILPGDETPRGFAITNLQSMSEGELIVTFLALQGSIQDVGLFDYGNSNPEMLYGNLQLQLPILMVPLPPPLGLALAGLIGVVILRRRLCHSNA